MDKNKAIHCPYADEIIQQKERDIERLNRRIRELEKMLLHEKSALRCAHLMLKEAREQINPKDGE